MLEDKEEGYLYMKMAETAIARRMKQITIDVTSRMEKLADKKIQKPLVLDSHINMCLMKYPG